MRTSPPPRETPRVETEALLAVMRKNPGRVQDLLDGMKEPELLRFAEEVEALWHQIRRARWREGVR
jgi:hypothetical protein